MIYLVSLVRFSWEKLCCVTFLVLKLVFYLRWFTLIHYFAPLLLCGPINFAEKVLINWLNILFSNRIKRANGYSMRWLISTDKTQRIGPGFEPATFRMRKARSRRFDRLNQSVLNEFVYNSINYGLFTVSHLHFSRIMLSVYIYCKHFLMSVYFV